jgi:phage gpG-like protein
MVAIKAKVKVEPGKLKRAAKAGTINSLGHAGAAIRLQARHSIKKGSKRSAPGTPPHTRKGRLRNAIKYAVQKERQSVVIGPDAEVAGDSGKAHEFGGKFRREHYPKRPFMGPALQNVADRLPTFWRGSVKS